MRLAGACHEMKFELGRVHSGIGEDEEVPNVSVTFCTAFGWKRPNNC